jgi:LPS O-antigen subunit length determinant protein (WzzB/FepE family)
MVSKAEEKYVDVSLYDLLRTAWRVKVVIALITGVFAILGLILAYTLPVSYSYKLELKPALGSEFLLFGEVNNLVDQPSVVEKYTKKDSTKLLVQDASAESSGGAYRVDAEYVYNLFIEEMSDKQEFQALLQNEPSISATLSFGTTEAQRLLALRNYSAGLKISQNASRDPKMISHSLEFSWGNKDAAQLLLSQTIADSLANVKARVINDLQVIANTRQETGKRVIANLKNEMAALNEFGVTVMQQRLAILQEQAAIARELAIEGTQVDRFDAADIVYPLDFDSNGTPLYLRGYKVLDKEIANLQQKIAKNETLGYEPYLNAQRDLLLLERDQSVAQIQTQIEFLKGATDVRNWVAFDLDVVEPRKKPSKVMILAIAIFVGLFASIIYVLFKEQESRSAL